MRHGGVAPQGRARWIPARFRARGARAGHAAAARRRSGWRDRIGSLEAGKQADLITVTMDGARQTPMFDAISHLVYVSHGDDVRNTIVAGRC